MHKAPLLGATALRSMLVIGAGLSMTAPALAQQSNAPPTPGAASTTASPSQDTPTAPLTTPASPETPSLDKTAAAQEATQDNLRTDAGQDVVVTGSRIRRPNLESPVPVTSVAGDAFFETGSTSVGDVLNQLPALRSTFSQSNSTRFLGTTGLSLLDLRGLGTQRTLVLVNGRRHVAGDILSDATSTDVNTIPTDLIDRVDVVTGGDSAVYGSDALAGVVNFVLKDHYQGIQVRGQAGTSLPYGDAPNQFVSLLAGHNFADGRGNIAVNFEYAHQGSFFASERPQYSVSNGFVQVRETGTASAPQEEFLHDIRSGVYSNGGTFLDYEGGNYYTPLIFQPGGTLVPQTGTQVQSEITSAPSYLGGNGDNFLEGQEVGFQPLLDRYSANLIGHFEISRAFVPFIEATYTRTDSYGVGGNGPFFTNALGERFQTDNPYLSNQARTIIRDYYGDADKDGINDADEYGFGMYKNVIDLTNRFEAARRETYRIVGGVKGDFNKDWNYELSVNYGEFDEHTHVDGNVNIQRYMLAIDAVDQGLATTGVANGKIVCRSQVDPAAGMTYAGADAAYAQAELANDIAQCVPVNLFGAGTVTDAARNYLLQSSTARGKITQLDVSGFVNGDTSGFFNLPGGPVGFAAGFEYRRETNFYQQDAATASAITFYNAIPEFNPTAFEVKEGYAEIRIPILKESRFGYELTLNGAARVADYKGSTGTVWAYNGGFEYAPVKDFLIRGNYSRSVRAPNLSDQYTPLGQNYFSFSDPCASQNITAPGASQYRAANCKALGVPATYDYEYRATPGYLSGGNPDLQAETSDSFTIGGVFTPHFLRGFSFTADYYNITVRNVINTPDPQTIIDACVDLPTINNQFCGLFQRDVTGDPHKQGEYVNNSLHDVPLNFAKLVNSGIDFEVAYDHHIGRLGELSVLGRYTLALQKDQYLDPTNPNFADRFLSELGDPQNEFTIDSSFKTGPITIGYKFHYIDRMTNGAWEEFFSVQGRPATDPYAVAKQYEFYPIETYHDVRLQIDVNKMFNFYVGVDNLTNTLPPFGLTGIGAGSAIYPNVGRYGYAGFVAKF